MMNELPRCYRCEYDLTGLPAEGECPECGEPVHPTQRHVDFFRAGSCMVAAMILGIGGCLASPLGLFAFVFSIPALCFSLAHWKQRRDGFVPASSSRMPIVLTSLSALAIIAALLITIMYL